MSGGILVAPRLADVTDLAPDQTAPSAAALVAPIGGLVVGFIVRRDVRLTGERGDGIAFAAILIGATLTMFGIIVPLFLDGTGSFDLDLQL